MSDVTAKIIDQATAQPHLTASSKPKGLGGIIAVAYSTQVFTASSF